jgi:hypothetical protein
MASRRPQKIAEATTNAKKPTEVKSIQGEPSVPLPALNRCASRCSPVHGEGNILPAGKCHTDSTSP